MTSPAAPCRAVPMGPRVSMFCALLQAAAAPEAASRKSEAELDHGGCCCSHLFALVLRCTSKVRETIEDHFSALHGSCNCSAGRSRNSLCTRSQLTNLKVLARHAKLAARWRSDTSTFSALNLEVVPRQQGHGSSPTVGPRLTQLQHLR